MKSRAEMLICGCQDDDVAVIRKALGRGGPDLTLVGNPMTLAQYTVARHIRGIILGVGDRTINLLDIIALVYAVRNDVPVIVIGENDSLDLERRARQRGIFYYLVHPIAVKETEAVLKDLLRRS